MKAVIINGPMGVGKTTVGKYIADHYAGTALIDGDWCMDIHPFVGNRETKEMAVDNILHMVENYRKCSVCRMVVLVWLMDDNWVRERIQDGLHQLGMDIRNVTLICEEKMLIERWRGDTKCEWRTDEWLHISLKSLPEFRKMENIVDTTALSITQIADVIMDTGVVSDLCL